MKSIENRKLIKKVVWAFFILVPAAAAAAQSNDDGQTLRGKTRDAILLMTNLDFAAADRVCTELKGAYPNAPHVPFLESYKYLWRFYLSGNEKSRTAEFGAAIHRLISASSVSEVRYEQDRLLFLACARFFTAAIHKEGGRAGAALIEITSMSSAAAELLRRYPGLADGRFITGSTAAYSGTVPVPTADLELASKQGYYFAPMARFVLAQALADTDKNYSGALTLYRQLAAEYPGNALFHYHLARTYQRMGLARDSLDSYRRAVSTLHLQPPATSFLCRSYFASGQILESQWSYDQAIAEYENALFWADERNAATAWYVPRSHLQIGRCLERAGRYTLALAHLESVKKEPDGEAYRWAQCLAADIRSRMRAGGQ